MSRSNILDPVDEVLLRKLEVSRMPSVYYFDPSVPFRLPLEGEALDSYSGDSAIMTKT